MRLCMSCLSAAPHRRKGQDNENPIEFDYDLWTTKDGKCMVRVKSTGETCEVSREAFRVLRAEENGCAVLTLPLHLMAMRLIPFFL